LATTARRLVSGGVALAFFWFSSAIVLPRLAAAPGHSALATLSIVGTSDLDGRSFRETEPAGCRCSPDT